MVARPEDRREPPPGADDPLCVLLDAVGRSVIAIGKALLDYARARRHLTETASRTYTGRG